MASRRNRPWNFSSTYTSCNQYTDNAQWRITYLTKRVSTLEAWAQFVINNKSIGGGGSSLNYLGTWNAATNNPTLSNNGGGGTKNDYYIVDTSGSTLVDGVNTWAVGDWVVNNGSIWERINNASTVISVNGKMGVVVIDAVDVGLGDVTNESKAVMFNDPTFTGVINMENVVFGVKHYTGAGAHMLAADGEFNNTVTHTGEASVYLPTSPPEGSEYRVINYGTGGVRIHAQAPNYLDTIGVGANTRLNNYLDKISFVYIDNVWNIMM